MFARSDLLHASSLVAASVIDLLIVALVFLNVLRGRKLGVPRQVLSNLGFIAGLYLGVIVVPLMLATSLTLSARAAVTFTVVIGAGLFVGFVGDRAGVEMSRAGRILFGQMGLMGKIVSGVLSGATTVVVVWLLSGMVITSSFRSLDAGLQRSVILRVLAGIAPYSASFASRVQSIIDPNGFPQVFEGLEPLPGAQVDVADQAAIDNAVAADGNSTVVVEGLGCGGFVSGSGFVAAPDQVITAAHVVAGLKTPVVVDQNGLHTATVVKFDPRLDVAILKSSHLAGGPLAFPPKEAGTGSEVVVLGYPNGGPLVGVRGGIFDMQQVTGLDIYGRDSVDRSLDFLQAGILPGDSGGPVVLSDGTVSGMVIARSLVTDAVGYSLSAEELAPIVASAKGLARAVGTGACPGSH
jgi:S1-C subfamily serine protease